ncbi:hypothetical protein C8J56DRAFT_921979 [Mycena floridula]|nr:hypothetical protein C8J56DRAFT_921979 [Mycena floridula]
MASQVISLTVDSSGTVLSYTDSGNPGTSDYVTIFAIHGTAYNNRCFKRIQAVSAAQNVRFVAVNCLQYAGSSPYSETELQTLIGGSEAEKREILIKRGLEIARFVDVFIREHDIPPISEDGKCGGIVLLGWSAGARETVSAIAGIDQLPPDSAFKTHLRAHIMHEVPCIALGLQEPPLHWSPFIDSTIPRENQIAMFVVWVSSYFDHGDLETRDPKVLSYVAPSSLRRPSIYDMTAEEISEMIDEPALAAVAGGFVMATPEMTGIYRKACFETPGIKTTCLGGTRTYSSIISAIWAIEDDNLKHGGSVRTILIPGANHFVHWEDPEQTLKTFTEAF